MKSATTTLFTQLVRHPGVHLGPKEPHFFSKDPLFARGADFYAGRYAEAALDERVLVDASQSYLPLPDVPARIRAVVGEEARFVVVLRDPVARMESAFKHVRYKEGGELARELDDVVPSAARLREMDLDALIRFETAAVRDGLESGSIVPRDTTWARYGFPFNYAEVSAYARHLRRYLDLFPRDRFLFLRFEDVTRSQTEAVERVLAFAGLPGPAPVEEPLNATAQQYRAPWLGRVLGPLKRTVRPLIPRSAARVLGRAERSVLKTHVRIRFEPDVRAELQRLFADDVAETAALTGLDLGSWTPPRVS